MESDGGSPPTSAPPTAGPTSGPTDGPTTTEGPTNSSCINEWIADAYCDDQNNNYECQFDGGDCCQENPEEGWDNYCEECACLESPPTTEPPMETTGMPMDNCAVPHWFGDGYCDDENNNEE